MVKKLISLTLPLIFLLTIVAACTRYVPFERHRPNETTSTAQTTPPLTTQPPLVTDPPPWQPPPPPNTTPPRPAPTAPILPDRFTWHIEPTLWFEHGIFHEDGRFWAVNQYMGFEIDTYTGEMSSQHYGLGGRCGPGFWAHDPRENVFALVDMGLVSPSCLISYDEFRRAVQGNTFAPQMHMVQEFDTRIYEVHCDCCEWTYFPNEAFTARHAVYRGAEQLTEFVFDFSLDTLFSALYWRRANVIPARLYGTSLYGIVDEHGDVVVPHIFERIVFIRQGGFFVRYQGFYGVINVDGLFRQFDPHEPPDTTPPHPAPTAPTLPDRFTWHIEPSLWFEYGLHTCCGAFWTYSTFWTYNDKHFSFEVNPYTGQVLTQGNFCTTSSPYTAWYYDPRENIFFSPPWGDGYGRTFTHQEFEEHLRGERRMILKMEFDSTRYTICEWSGQVFAQDGFTGRSAVFYGVNRLTDFIFGHASGFIRWNWDQANVIPVRPHDETLIGFVDTNGDIVVQPMFERVLHIREGGFFVRYQGFYGVINVDGLFQDAPLAPPRY